MVLTGEPGSGKTTVLRYFLEWLQQKHGYSSAYIFYTLLTSEDLLRLILKDFGIPCDARSKSELLTALSAWLLQRHRLGDCPVILIDEAQALTTAALEEVRMLLNLEITGVKLVQIVLAGQPLLEQKLRRRQLAELRQRMVCHCQLPLLTLDETSGYIVKRLAWAGSGNPGLFAPGTVQEIFKYSNGNPRVINLICEHALLSSYADRRNSVDPGDVAAVALDFELGGAPEPGQAPSRPGTFCRVIPFPQLGLSDSDAVPEDIATLAPGDQAKATSATPGASNANRAVSVPVLTVPPNSYAPETVISRLKSAASLLRSRLLSYSHAVRTSFARDGQRLIGQCLEWLNKPNGMPGLALPAGHRVVRSAHEWLTRPLGSKTVTPHRPRISAGKHKQS